MVVCGHCLPLLKAVGMPELFRSSLPCSERVRRLKLLRKLPEKESGLRAQLEFVLDHWAAMLNNTTIMMILMKNQDPGQKGPLTTKTLLVLYQALC